MFARILRLGLRVNGSTPACINTIHNVHEGGLHRMTAYKITSLWVDRVTAVSIAASERFVRLGAVPKRKMSVITNGIDTEEFAPDTKRRKLVRRQMNLGTDFVWLSAGRLVPAKDYPNLLRSFQALLELEPFARLWIAGEGNIQDLFASHTDLKTDLPSIEWLGLRRDMADLLEAADGFVLSSAWEGMPLVIGEAMSMGKPVVATNVGGVSELMGNTGILVPPADHRALTAAMRTVVGWSDLERRRAAIDARTRIVSQFSIDARVQTWASFYEESLSGHRHD
jgi:glycosyltransferase involved in cell wall biosynthesis